MTLIPHLPLARAYSVPASARKVTASEVVSPREYLLRRVDSVENITEIDENVNTKALMEEVLSLNNKSVLLNLKIMISLTH